MDIHTANISIAYSEGKNTMVSLKWLRGANRYNNGATRYLHKYRIRLIIGWAATKKLSQQNGTQG